MPKEHGSWGMFFLPMLAGFLVAGHFPLPGTALFLAAAILIFLAREPFLSAWRQWRRHQPFGPAERRSLGMLALAVVLGGALLPSYPWLIVPGVLGGIVLVWQAVATMTGQGRSVPTELTAIAVSMLNAPVAAYVASGGELRWLWAGLFLLCFAYFGGTVFYVKMRVKAAHAKVPAMAESARRACAGYHGLMAILVGGSAIGGLIPWLTAAVYLPAILRAFWYVTKPTKELNLKQIGWTEVVFSLLWLVGITRL